jgi:hypothetical protein
MAASRIKNRVEELHRKQGEFAAKMVNYIDNPVEFILDTWYGYFVANGIEPDKIETAVDTWQKEVLMALAERNYVAVTGANEVGKTTVASFAIWWFMCTRVYPRIQCTSVDKIQLNTILWSELRSWYDRSKDITEAFEYHDTMVFHKQFKKTWFALARTAKKQHDSSTGENEHVTGLQGMHAPHLLFVLDEASGIEDPNWEAAESSIREADNRLLAISNPLRVSGRMFQIFNLSRYKKYWYTKQVSYLDSSRLTDKKRQIIEDQIEMYGENSPIVQIRHYGKFPTLGAPDAVPSYDSVRAAIERAKDFDTKAINTLLSIMGRHKDVLCPYTKDQLNIFLKEISSERQPQIEYDRFFNTSVNCDDPLTDLWEEIVAQYFQPPHRLGLDLARFGTSETVWARRRGWRILPLLALTGMAGGNGVQIISRTKDLMSTHDIDCVIVDKTGITGGMAVEDHLVNDGFIVLSIGFGEESSRPDMYLNAATEMWFFIAENIEKMMLPNDPMLITQLTTRRFTYTGRKIRKGNDYAEQRIIESKDSLRKRYLESPDRADACCLAMAPIGIVGDDEDLNIDSELSLPHQSGVIEWD